MGRKKKKREPDYQPWCYYCDRKFTDETVLIQHQKARHFKCSICHKKMTTAQGLSVHCSQVHKTVVEAVPNAKPGREDPLLEIFGMAGVPEGSLPGAPLPEDPDERFAKMARAEDSAAAAPPPVLQPPGSMHPTGHLSYPGHQPYPPQPHLMIPGQHGYLAPPGIPPGGMFMQQGPLPHIPPFQRPPFGPPGSMPPAMPGVPSQPLFPVSNEPQLPASVRPHSQPLFPLGPTAPSPQLFPISASGAGSNGTNVSATQAAGITQPPDAHLIWADAALSMEEERAMLPKYQASTSLHGPHSVAHMPPGAET